MLAEVEARGLALRVPALVEVRGRVCTGHLRRRACEARDDAVEEADEPEGLREVLEDLQIR